MKQTLNQQYPGIHHQYLVVGDGDVYANPTAVQTVLGSCVAVTFFCTRTNIGGTFHALMPEYEIYAKPDEGPQPLKYVDTAINKIYNKMLKMGAKQHDIECKIFGGATSLVNNSLSVGPKNVEVAFRTLASYPLRVATTNVGGDKGRKMLFLTHTGEVFMKHIPKDVLTEG